MGPNIYAIRVEFEFMRYDVLMTVNIKIYCLLGPDTVLSTR
jgi:hypothetical protein